MDDTGMCPRPLAKQDAAALIGITSTLTAELMSAQLDDALVERLRQRLTKVGLLDADRADDLVAALEDLTQRLHHAWGA